MLDSSLTGLLSQFGLDVSNLGPLLSSALLISILEVITAFPTARIAKRKGRSTILWVLLALSIPVLPLALVWLLPDARPKPPPAEK